MTNALHNPYRFSPEKVAIYRRLTVDQLAWNLSDAQEALRAAESMGNLDAEYKYSDDCAAIRAELKRREKGGRS